MPAELLERQWFTTFKGRIQQVVPKDLPVRLLTSTKAVLFYSCQGLVENCRFPCVGEALFRGAF